MSHSESGQFTTGNPQLTMEDPALNTRHSPLDWAIRAYQEGDIPGIVGNNAKRTVTFNLVAPRGDFLSILALLFASPVPAGTPNSDQSSNNLPSTGPYHIIDYTQNVGGTLVRNKFFKPTKNIPNGNPDKITVKLVSDASAAIDQVTRGQAEYTEEAVPPDRLGSLEKSHGKFLRFYASANTYYFWMNTRSPVFKQRRLPRSKKETIDLMMENPNLIRRPILIRGSKVVFGFDRDAYDKLKSRT